MTFYINKITLNKLKPLFSITPIIFILNINSMATALETTTPSKTNSVTKHSTLDTKKDQKIMKKLKPIKTKNTITYYLTIDYKTVNLGGKNTTAMLVNDSLPAPTLYFEEGKKAIIYVTNKMKVNTSIHWHGILLPNFEDGVPYVTSPPIEPGKTHKFEFTLKQSGTYWYHSHSGLQEQKGIYGAIIVEPKKRKYNYTQDLVLVLSDWTDKNPHEILRTLKRGSEWYALKKGSALSLSQVIQKKVLGAQISLWKHRMPGMDISDVYYNNFLINGKNTQQAEINHGEKVRLRIINAAASTYFWLSFGGDKPPLLISTDGIDVEPVYVNKILHAIGETYDLLVTIPKKHSIEIKAMAQDGSGNASILLGKKDKYIKPAPIIPKPDPAQQIKLMANMHTGHAKHAKHAGHTKDKEHTEHTGDAGHAKDKEHTLHNKTHKKHHNHSPTNFQEQTQNTLTTDQHDQTDPSNDKKTSSDNDNMDPKNTDPPTHQIQKKEPLTLHYEQLKALKKTTFPNKKIKELHFNLTGNMWRYTWSINGVPLSKSDTIAIKKGETVLIHLHNTTMMHHPMHLHGHFFRVLNKHKNFSPLKHTIDVPPMQTVSIEFSPDEKGDWLFHCHVLYHMKSGMSRLFRNDNSVRDLRLKNYPLSTALNMDNQWYKWGEASIMSNRLDIELIGSNTNNKLALEGTFSWVNNYYNLSKNIELELSHEYFMSDFFRIYFSGEIINKTPSVLEQIKDLTPIGKFGIRYLLPYFIELDLNIDHKLRPQIGLDYELLLFPYIELFMDIEWTLDFGLISSLPEDQNWEQELEWSIGSHYMFHKNFSIIASYDNHFGWGMGINWKF